MFCYVKCCEDEVKLHRQSPSWLLAEAPTAIAIVNQPTNQEHFKWGIYTGSSIFRPKKSKHLPNRNRYAVLKYLTGDGDTQQTY